MTHRWQQRAAVLAATRCCFFFVIFVFFTTGALAATSTSKTTSALATTRSCPSAPPSTLTFACDSACFKSQACLAASANDSSSSAIGCRCFDSAINKFTFLIPFDAATNTSLNRASFPKGHTYPGAWDLGVYPWASNDEVSKIAPLTLPGMVTSVKIRGGSSYEAVAKGFVARVDIDPTFLATQSQVKDLHIGNLNLSRTIDGIAKHLPIELQTLEVPNTAITAFPSGATQRKLLGTLVLSYNNIERVTSEHAIADLNALWLNVNQITHISAVYPNLEYLNLEYNKLTLVPDVIAQYARLKTLNLGGNAIATFNQSHAVPSLSTLWLLDNNLTAFGAYLPNLAYLDLSGNRLTEFPSVVFSHARLMSLYLHNNPKITNVSFTNEEASFLNALTKLSITTTSLQMNCAEEQQFALTRHALTICIRGAKNESVILGPRIVAPVPAGVASLSASVGTPSPASSPDAPDAPTPAPTVTTTTSLVVPLAIGSSSVLALLLVAIAVVLLQKRRNANATDEARSSATAESDDLNRRGKDGILSLYDDADILSFRVDASDVEDVKKLGSGAFADVWLVRFRGAELMASKRLRANDVSRKRTQDFVSEIKLVATLSHPSIVELKGVAWIRESDLQALFEYMDRGDLRTYLVDPQVPLQWTAEKLQIAIDVAEALVYVHSFSPALVHRDLKSRNVLLQSASSSGDGHGHGVSSDDTDVRAKLTDFGVSRYQSEQNTMTAGVGTSRWLAPEVIAGDTNYGAPADIFSFGVLLSELDTHAIPYADMRDVSASHQFADVAILQRVAAGELVPTLSASCPSSIAELASRCLAFKAADRPSAPEVAYALRTLRKSLASDESV